MPPLSLSGRQWILKRQEPFSAGQGIAEILARERGISDLDAPGTGKLSDPFLFPEMGRAVERVEEALKKGENIGIFGDYDADGITGTLQLIHYFRRRGVEPYVYLPDRLTEGYGLKLSSIDNFKERGVGLIITVDTGISALAEISAARAAGIDVIVTDHHKPRTGRPDAFAVLHPLVPDKFPNAHLSGSGVAFMFVRALEHLNIWEGIAEDAALAAIGTVGDLVPLTGENRTLVFHGLKFLNSLQAGPLKEMIESVRSSAAPLTSGDIAFRIVPRINAAGRMEHPSLALNALMTGGAAMERLHELNNERRALVDELTEVALQLIDPTQLFLTLRHKSFTPGVVGLIAGRLADLYGKPALVASIENGKCVASIRSTPQIDVMECLEHPQVRPHLWSFGGHAQAAGCTITESAFSALATGLSQSVRDMGINADTLIPALLIDGELFPGALETGMVRRLKNLEPFGKHNEEPVFLIRNLQAGDIRTCGRDNRHLQCRLNGTKAIGFSLGKYSDQISSGTPVDAACKVNISNWNGKEELEYIIQDLRKM